MLRRYLIPALLLALLAALLSGCGQGGGEAAKLSFAESASLDTLKSLNGKSVTITGYMATLSPLDGSYIYLMNLPYQSCPFCVPNTQQLANTMAVYAPDGKKFEFTDRPVRITGRLKLGDFSDDYGYTYNYRVENASMEVVNLAEVSEDYALYEALAEDGVIGDVNAMFDYLLYVCQWTDYQVSYVDDNGQQVSYFLYPGDVERSLEDDGPNGYAAQADPNYFPGLIARVDAVNGAKLTELKEIIADAASVEAYARGQLADGAYRYLEDADRYALDDAEGLYNRFYEVYARFSQWLTKYQL